MATGSSAAVGSVRVMQPCSRCTSRESGAGRTAPRKSPPQARLPAQGTTEIAEGILGGRPQLVVDRSCRLARLWSCPVRADPRCRDMHVGGTQGPVAPPRSALTRFVASRAASSPAEPVARHPRHLTDPSRVILQRLHDVEAQLAILKVDEEPGEGSRVGVLIETPDRRHPLILREHRNPEEDLTNQSWQRRHRPMDPPVALEIRTRAGDSRTPDRA